APYPPTGAGTHAGRQAQRLGGGSRGPLPRAPGTLVAPTGGVVLHLQLLRGHFYDRPDVVHGARAQTRAGSDRDHRREQRRRCGAWRVGLATARTPFRRWASYRWRLRGACDNAFRATAVDGALEHHRVAPDRSDRPEWLGTIGFRRQRTKPDP